jgi:hypothetical protein
VGRAPALLSPRRAGAFLALLLVDWLYYAFASDGPNLSVWWDVAFFGFVLLPAVFALVLLALPLHDARGLPLLALALGAVAAVLAEAGIQTGSNFAKLFAIVALAWWFLLYFETAGWVVLVACIIPWVDAYSVWRGPTGDIVKHKPGLFEQLSIAFTPLGEHGAARLGLPDILFFSLFLAAAARFGLRVSWTWVALVASFGGTIACAVAFQVDGLPALPGVALGFLLPNLDLLWRRRSWRPNPK